MSDEVLHACAAYEWTLNHVIEARDPCEFFDTQLETVGRAAVAASAARPEEPG